jgi:uncharacterized protein
MPLIESTYRAPWWLPGGNAQTLHAALLAKAAWPRYERERWRTPDDDFVDIDRWGQPAHSPLAVIFHGLEGDSRSHYARALACAFHAKGWRVAIPHFRGCSGVPNALPRAYHSGDSEEVKWMLGRFAREHGAPVAAVGISLGGNALLKALGEVGTGATETVMAAAAVSAPLDLMVAGDTLGRGFARLYSAVFLRTLKKKSEEKAVRFPSAFDAGAMRRSRSLREFDNVVTAPLHGFRDTDDYWTRSSSKPWLGSIRVPTLVLNARNDPFLPAFALPQGGDLSADVTAEFPDEGGHVGFISGAFPGNFDWFTQRIIEFVGRAPLA